VSDGDRTPGEACFELVAYLLTSARDLLDEPLAYGPFRLLEAASRLVEIAEQVAPGGDCFLAELKRDLDRDRVYLVTADAAAFEAWLDRLGERIAAEVVVRNGLPDPGEGAPAG
jgi:hypothetical protein